MGTLETVDDAEQGLPPAEAFALLGNETRVAILESLWDLDDEPASFSKLYEQIDADDSSRFNYHLSQLTGHFVRKTDDGYELRTAGESVVQAVVEGAFNAHPRLEPFETGDACTRCGAELIARYEDEQLAIDCPECGRSHGEYAFPSR